MRAPADVRICRACGCWELHACESGCAWLSADRCSACPDAALRLPIRAAHLECATMELRSVITDDNGEDRLHVAVEFPSVVLVTRHDKAGRYVGPRLFVGDEEMLTGFAYAQAAELLNERRLAA
ncbi:MAG: hypothetical protein Q7J26_01960 [Brevundimonas sp.]|jgi:hypothetical protein|uniref:hypothetical protein n=1 Tax=Brevundimonas sp. TaxID=1871086 RepID=UPI002715BA21|nr:hypothetical protein [Brevundimonas sp.]MDO9607263.1 hypothetical protein [Brevundimonas sp.]